MGFFLSHFSHLFLFILLPVSVSVSVSPRCGSRSQCQSRNHILVRSQSLMKTHSHSLVSAVVWFDLTAMGAGPRPRPR